MDARNWVYSGRYKIFKFKSRYYSDRTLKCRDSYYSGGLSLSLIHIFGGHNYFPNFYAHAAELDWLNGKFPLSMETIREMVVDRCDLPDGFDVGSYEFFQGTPTRIVADHDMIDLGGRQIEVLHTPGHSPGHLCFWEKDTGYLFTGDLVYKDVLFAYYPSTDPEAYLTSLKKVASLPVKRAVSYTHLDVYKRQALYISYILKKNRIEYYDRMSEVRNKDNYEQWVRFFLQAVKESAEDATEAIHKLSALHDRNEAVVKQMGRCLLYTSRCV